MLSRKLCFPVLLQIAKASETCATAALGRFFGYGATGAGQSRKPPCLPNATCIRAGLRAALLAIAAFGPSACAGMDGIAQVGRTTYNVEKLGHGAYSVRTHVIGPMGGADDAKADNVQAATKYCAKKGLAMTAISDKGSGGLAAEDTLTFRCGPPAKTT